MLGGGKKTDNVKGHQSEWRNEGRGKERRKEIRVIEEKV